MVCCTAVIKSFHDLLIVRFFLGVLEAGFTPGVFLILFSWYKKDEQGKRFSIFYSAAVLSGAFESIISGTIMDNIHDAYDITAWRWLFVYGTSIKNGIPLTD